MNPETQRLRGADGIRIAEVVLGFTDPGGTCRRIDLWKFRRGRRNHHYSGTGRLLTVHPAVISRHFALGDPADCGSCLGWLHFSRLD